MTDNELIAEFVGHDVPSDYLNGSQLNNCYHNSWDWLMPVVEKINKVDDYSCIHIDHNTIYLLLKNNDMKCFNFGNSHFGKSGVTMINAVYSAVVFFIKWYNEHKL